MLLGRKQQTNKTNLFICIFLVCLAHDISLLWTVPGLCTAAPPSIPDSIPPHLRLYANTLTTQTLCIPSQSPTRTMLNCVTAPSVGLVHDVPHSHGMDSRLWYPTVLVRRLQLTLVPGRCGSNQRVRRDQRNQRTCTIDLFRMADGTWLDGRMSWASVCRFGRSWNLRTWFRTLIKSNQWLKKICLLFPS